MKETLKRIPIIGELARHAYRALHAPAADDARTVGSASYWQIRYGAGGNSGDGSYGDLARFKAEVLNALVAEHAIDSVIEFGCGDGNQLRLANYPRYVGYDVSPAAVARCRSDFAGDSTKRFGLLHEFDGGTADMSLSLDVVYHLIEDEAFERHMEAVFDAARRIVVIYSSNLDDDRRYDGSHVRHRQFTRWIERYRPDWRLERHVPNRYPRRQNGDGGSFAEFFIYAALSRR